MEIDEAIKLLKEMKENCIDKGKTYYEDDKRAKKAQAIETVLNSLNNYRNKDFLTVNVRYDDVKEEVEKTINNIKINYVSKDKIREKLEELKIESDRTYIKFLQTNKTDIKLHDKGIKIDGQKDILKELLEDK